MDQLRQLFSGSQISPSDRAAIGPTRPIWYWTRGQFTPGITLVAVGYLSLRLTISDEGHQFEATWPRADPDICRSLVKIRDNVCLSAKSWERLWPGLVCQVRGVHVALRQPGRENHWLRFRVADVREAFLDSGLVVTMLGTDPESQLALLQGPPPALQWTVVEQRITLPINPAWVEQLRGVCRGDRSPATLTLPAPYALESNRVGVMLWCRHQRLAVWRHRDADPIWTEMLSLVEQ